MEGVVLVVVMDTELEKQKGAGHIEQHGCYGCAVKCGAVPGSHQPSLERDGVDVEVFDQSQVVVHVFQTAQHLEEPQNPSANGRPLHSANVLTVSIKQPLIHTVSLKYG